MEAATRVLEAVEEARAGVTPGDGGAVGAGTPTASSASKESQLAAMNNLLKAENSRLKDQALHDATKIKELASGLADKEEELLVAQRKFLQMKQAGGGNGGKGDKNVAGTAASPAPATATAGAATGEMVDSVEQAALVAELEDVKRSLEKREVEVEERDGALTKSER
jgi:hypothetical protein